MTEDEIVQAVADRVRTGRSHDNEHPDYPPPGPAPTWAVEDAEWVIGYPLPSVLRRVYLEVANGGVGPFNGIVGLQGGWTDHGEYDELAAGYVLHQNAPWDPEDGPAIPPGVAFLCDWGCAMLSFVDFREPGGRMWWWEEGNRYVLNQTVAQWFEGWLDGSMGSPRYRPDLRIDGHPDQWERPRHDLDPAPPDADA